MKSVILNYRDDFAPLIQSGAKPHTIRPRRNDGLDPFPGDVLQHYARFGTKHAYLLRSEICTYAAEVTILPSVKNEHQVFLGGELLSPHNVEVLAAADGFLNAAEFIRFFQDLYGLPFSGLFIAWNPTLASDTKH